MTVPLKDSTVLLLRSRGDSENDEFEEVFSHNGLQTIQLPVLDFIFTNQLTLTEKLQRAADYSCLVFTSQRALEAVEKLLENEETLLEAWRDKPVFVVGGSTERAARKLGLGQEIRGSEAGNAENLLRVIVNAGLDKSKAILFPCGNLRRETIPDGLRAAGYTVEELTVYETSARPELENDLKRIVNDKGTPEFVCFFSPSGVRYTRPALVNLDLVDRIKTISMGPSTSDALRECEMTPTAEAEKPTAASIARAVLLARDRQDS